MRIPTIHTVCNILRWTETPRVRRHVRPRPSSQLVQSRLFLPPMWHTYLTCMRAYTRRAFLHLPMPASTDSSGRNGGAALRVTTTRTVQRSHFAQLENPGHFGDLPPLLRRTRASSSVRKIIWIISPHDSTSRDSTKFRGMCCSLFRVFCHCRLTAK